MCVASRVKKICMASVKVSEYVCRRVVIKKSVQVSVGDECVWSSVCGGKDDLALGSVEFDSDEVIEPPRVQHIVVSDG